MNTVQPIRNLSQIKQMESILRQQSERNYILFRLGIYSGLRISDILNLKVKDLRDQDYFILKEKKTGKSKRLKIQSELKLELNNYIKNENLNDDDFIIGSRERKDTIKITNRTKNELGKYKNIEYIVRNTASNSPLQRMQAWRIINNTAKQVGITEPIGTHSLRKSFGYHIFIKNKSNTRILAILQDIFNHSSPHITLKYIGISQDEMDDIINDLDFDYAI
jgi:integrase